jgi:hypothetical protein
MRDRAPPFSVMDFVWEEIKGTLPHVHYRRCNQSKLSKGRVPHAFQAQSYQEASDPNHSHHLSIESRADSSAAVVSKIGQINRLKWSDQSG